MVVDHLSRLKFNDFTNDSAIQDDLCDEHLFAITKLPWHAHMINYLLTSKIPPAWSAQYKCKFLAKVHNFYWDDPYPFKYSPDQIMRSCIPEDEVTSV